MKKSILFVCASIVLSLPVASLGYEVSTHAVMTFKTYGKSTLPNALSRLGFSGDSDLSSIYFDVAPDGTVEARLNNPIETGDERGAENYTKDKFDAANKRLVKAKLPVPDFQSPVGWMMVGSIREDDVAYAKGETDNTPQDDPQGNIYRLFNHFYDPYLDAPGILGNKTPVWAIEGTDFWGNHRNHFSVADAKEAMFRAATLKTLVNGQLANINAPANLVGANSEDIRKAYWATVFRSLGDISHLLHDMAQPQHTRIEGHAGRGCLGSLLCLTGNTSFFEKYLEARATGEESFKLLEYAYQNLPNPNPGQDGSIPIISLDLTYDGYPIPRFNGYYDYYRSAGTGNSSFSGTGLANFSNMNFYTAINNVDPCYSDRPQPVYPRPPKCSAQLNADSKTTIEKIPVEDIRDISGQSVKVTSEVQDASLELYDYPVTDNLSPTTQKARVTSLSIFNQFLADNGDGNQAFSLNYYNYNDQADWLLPRAVSYTAGLIDYFFRGNMEISLPKEGVYSVVDHADFAPPNEATDPVDGLRGFDKIKLTLKNTSGITDATGSYYKEAMSNGKLVAVLKFHRNLIYTDDLDGELEMGESADEFFATYSWEEEMVTSNPVDLTSLANGESAEFTFQFPDKGQMPINAVSDVTLSVVFKGTLGSETDAVVVSTQKLISPPTYYSVYNASDYLRLGNTCYQNAQILADDSLWALLNARCKVGHTLDPTCQASPMSTTLSFGSGSNRVTLTWDNSITERRFARIAFLGDDDPFVLQGANTLTNGTTKTWSQSFDTDAGMIFWFTDFRGVNYYEGEIQYLSGDASTSVGTCTNFLYNDPPLNPIPTKLEGDERYPVPATSITGW